MVGSTIKVVATAENGNTFESDETEEVGVYEALEILSAEQTGKNKVQVTFSAPATADDKITVKKGTTAVEFTEAFDDTTYLTKTLTFKNDLTKGTYTVTLTPADKDVDPSSVEFEAKSGTKAATLEIENKQLVMTKADFTEGYFFIKGYNEYENGNKEEVKPLSGLTVRVAPSDSASYDSSTGKVTVKYKTPGYSVIKNVSVFAQYTGKDGEIVTCSETLEVTNMGYPSEIEFGDVKKDGTPRPDGRITIAELGSNKYYVELNSVKDQFGNELSANDLNKLAKENFLTVIPTEGSPIYFGTNKTPFTTMGDKVVVFLTPNKNNPMPGEGKLIITGAGGTFEKDVTIDDDPYINSLSVSVPDLYENEWSDDFSFEAVDQYGDPINLYDFVPADKEYPQTLAFKDMNHQVNKTTTIAAEQFGTWKVKKDTVKKTYHITYLPNGDEKSVVTFTTIPAGLLATKVHTATIGAKGKGALIVPQTSAATIEFGGTSNINSYIKFRDANGKTMDRLDPADAKTTYPKFIGGANADGIVTNAKIEDKDITKWVWTVSTDKLAEDSKTANTTALNAGNYDADGVIDGNISNANDVLAVSAANPVANYYVTLLGEKGGEYKVLDSQAFRFIYVPTSQRNVKYKVNDTSKNLLYAAPGSEDKEEIKVTATNDAGESWTVPAADISLTPESPFTSDGNKVVGNIANKQGKGTLDVKVYVNTHGADGVIAVDTVKIAYDDADPVATSTSKGLETTDEATNGTVPEGKNWKPEAVLDLTTGTAKAVVTMNDGAFQITNATVWGDTFTASIQDQYGVTMKNSTVKMNGYELGSDNAKALANKAKGNFVITNGTQKVDLDLTSGTGTVEINKAVYTASTTVNTGKDLVDALIAAAKSDKKDTITVGGTITDVPANITVAAGDTLVIPAPYVVETAKKVTNNGTIRGELDADGNVDPAKCGTLKINGTAVTSQAELAGDGGSFILPANSLEFLGNVNVTGKLLISGHVVIGDGTAATKVAFDKDSEIALVKDTKIEVAGTTDTVSFMGSNTIVADEEGTAAAGTDSITVETTNGTGTLMANDLEAAASKDETGEVEATGAIIIAGNDNVTSGVPVVSGDAKAIVNAIAALPDNDTIKAYASFNDTSAGLGLVDDLDDLLKAVTSSEEQTALVAEINALSGKSYSWSDLTDLVTSTQTAIDDAAKAIVGKAITSLSTAIETYLGTDGAELTTVEADLSAVERLAGIYFNQFKEIDNYKDADKALAAVDTEKVCEKAQELIDVANITWTVSGNKITFATAEGSKTEIAFKVESAKSGEAVKTSVFGTADTAKVLTVTATVSIASDAAQNLIVTATSKNYVKTITFKVTATEGEGGTITPAVDDSETEWDVSNKG